MLQNRNPLILLRHMKALLIYPRFPSSIWSFEIAVAFVNRKVLLPPLSLATVAALLPEDWELKLVDTNIRAVTQDEWAWADIVLLSAMNVQRYHLDQQITLAREHGKPVVVGGPYATSQPEAVRAMGANFLVLDEGELTIPPFIEALSGGITSGTFMANGKKPSLTQTPIPRFELLDLDAYDTMSIQFSRGCPFLCEFCDITSLYGRRPRTKSPAQMLAELERLRELGWARSIFIVDDNFIGDRRQTIKLLNALHAWQHRQPFPYSFLTQVSVDLAKDTELLKLMVDCRFSSVFLGIETPDEMSLASTRKKQNLCGSLVESVDTITRAGLLPMAGFIIGFDGEKSGAGRRIETLVEQTAIPIVMLSMLQALPRTALWHRLESEGRLLPDAHAADVNQTTLMNFKPSRPIAEIAIEYVESFHRLYDPSTYLHRVYQCCLKVAPPPRWEPPPDTRATFGLPSRGKLTDIVVTVRTFVTIIWRQGIRRSGRWAFWHYGIKIF
uniref:Radical SAM superfamily enzyme YgiQ, UPF0313 family n=1 Tax=Candidatus Kentrum sp. FW TaxID=2126338 RepID=A0A450SNZ1_9GAMM|nr:MAG: Radical SAM superfamily enzyme YgiQ, UPF0313 family [Candidatus Kentron sp. FW]